MSASAPTWPLNHCWPSGRALPSTITGMQSCKNGYKAPVGSGELGLLRSDWAPAAARSTYSLADLRRHALTPEEDEHRLTKAGCPMGLDDSGGRQSGLRITESTQADVSADILIQVKSSVTAEHHGV